MNQRPNYQSNNQNGYKQNNQNGYNQNNQNGYNQNNQNRFKQNNQGNFRPNHQGNNQQKGNYQPNNPQKLCGKCGKTNHYTNQCGSQQNRHINNIQVDQWGSATAPPEDSQTNIRLSNMANMNNQLPGTMGEIKGKKIRVYFDTGAEISIMSNDIAKQYNFKIKPSEIKLRMANNEIDDPIGETEPLDIRIDNTIVTIKFYVIKHNFHPILLGLDWFNQTGALISPGSDTPYIRMGQREV